jgi:hypothetical protein
MRVASSLRTQPGSGSSGTSPRSGRFPLSPDARVLYAGLCSFLGHKEINRQDLRNALKDHPDEEIARAVEELVGHDLLVPDAARGYEVRSVGEFG